MKINRPSRKTLMQFALVILAVFAIRAWQQQDLPQGMVPGFERKTLTGETLSSTANKATLIHFWATWCGICRVENDNIQAIGEDYRVLNIALQSGSDAELIEYAQQNSMQTNNIINDNSGSLARLFGVRATPSSFFISKDNKIAFTEVGYVTTLGYRLRLWWLNL